MSDTKYRKSCDSCLDSKIKCSQAMPSCSRCLRKGKSCIYSQYRKIGRPSKGSPLLQASYCPQSRMQTPPVSSLTGSCQSRTVQSPRYPNPDTISSSNSRRDFSHGGDNMTWFSKAFDTAIPTTLTWEWDSTQPSPMASDSPDQGLIFNYDTNADLSYFDLSRPDMAHVGNDFNASPSAVPMQTALGYNNGFEDSAQDDGSDWHASSKMFDTGQRDPSSHSSTPLLTSQFSLGAQTDHVQRSTHPVGTSSCSVRNNFDARMTTQSFPGFLPLEQHGVIVSDTALSDPEKYTGLVAPKGFRCSNNCYSNLSEQFTYLTTLIDNDHSVSLSSFLKLNEAVVEQRAKALRCSSCIGERGTQPALTLAIKVFEKVLTLFERQYQVSYHFTNEPLGLSRNPLPSIGANADPDETTPDEYFYKQMRTYLETQTKTMLQLNGFLANSAKNGVVREERTILVNTCKRLEHLKGVVHMAYFR